MIPLQYVLKFIRVVLHKEIYYLTEKQKSYHYVILKLTILYIYLHLMTYYGHHAHFPHNIPT